ncbi:hypothetical protein J4418_02930 [Candidatus Woesearchaeota archaeon]|nr:hypothetical protein [Candidatus Woesearchaeota archaeon]
MAKKVISLSVDEHVHDEYKTICEKKGLIVSRQFENLMIDEIKKSKESKN